MQISLHQAGKKFNKEWIFRNLDYTFEKGNHYALIGNNGSGKSTLLQAISGYATLSKGQIRWGTETSETIFKQLTIAAPYLELIEEFTALEQLAFHITFKPFIAKVSFDSILEKVGLTNAANKQIRYFSSGMKQRLKLAIAIFSDVPVLLLDEPCSNLDKEGIELYHHLIQQYALHKLIIVGSNDPQEYSFCNHQLNLLEYKK
jgi:ABC-type multidrug transport system ATPase subunit